MVHCKSCKDCKLNDASTCSDHAIQDVIIQMYHPMRALEQLVLRLGLQQLTG